MNEVNRESIIVQRRGWMEFSPHNALVVILIFSRTSIVGFQIVIARRLLLHQKQQQQQLEHNSSKSQPEETFVHPLAFICGRLFTPSKTQIVKISRQILHCNGLQKLRASSFCAINHSPPHFFLIDPK